MKLFLNTVVPKKAVVSLIDDKGNLISQEESTEPLVAIDQLLKKAHLKLKDIRQIDYHAGPGSFTGLRIGAAVVDSLNFALGRKVKTRPISYD